MSSLTSKLLSFVGLTKSDDTSQSSSIRPICNWTPPNHPPTAPWHVLPDAVWHMLLRDWLRRDCDVVQVALTEKASLLHPVMQSWKCRKWVTLKMIHEALGNPYLLNEDTQQTFDQLSPSSMPSDCQVTDLLHPQRQNSFLRVGNRGCFHRLIMGIEESDETDRDELALQRRIHQIASDVQELQVVISRESDLSGLKSLPSSIRVLTLTSGAMCAYSHIARIRRKSDFTLPLSQVPALQQLPSCLTELNLDDMEWKGQMFPLHGLQLPASLLKLKLPYRRFISPPWILPAGLEMLQMGGWRIQYEDRDYYECNLTQGDAMDNCVAATWPSFPPNLTSLHCGNLAEQSLRTLKLPAGLRFLTMNWPRSARMPLNTWPQPLPAGLQSLTVSGTQLSMDQLNSFLPQGLKWLNLEGLFELQSIPWIQPPVLETLDLEFEQYDLFWSSNRAADSHIVLDPPFFLELMQLPKTLSRFHGVPPNSTSGQFNDSPFEWPASLTDVKFATCFNVPLEEFPLPPNLVNLIFERSFNHSLEAVQWPQSLQTLQFDAYYNGGFGQPLRHWKPSVSLTELNLGSDWNMPLSRLFLPDHLRHLKLIGFTHSLDDANYTWPNDLETLVFASVKFDQPFNKWVMPPRLQRLAFFSGKWNHPLDEQRWPPTLRHLELPSYFRQSRLFWRNWPPLLKVWQIDIENEMEQCQTLGLHPFAFVDEDALRRMPASLQTLSLFLPSSPHPYDKDLWFHLERFASFLPNALRELILHTGCISRELHNAALPAIRRIQDRLPTSCILRLSEDYLPIDD